MAWSVEITRTAEKQLTKFSREVQSALLSYLRERVQVAEDPRQFGKALHGDKRRLWRYRVGDYRIICDIQDEELIVLVLAVAHRKDAHR